MIVVRLKGGVGNQLFQYAFGYTLSKKRGDELKLDIEWFDTEGNVPWLKKRKYELEPFAKSTAEIIRHKDLPFTVRLMGGRVIRRIFAKIGKVQLKFRKWLVVSTTGKTDFLNLKQAENIYLNGYFDDYATVWMADYIEDIKGEFKINSVNINTKKLIDEMQHCNSTSVHVRRTDQMHENGFKVPNGYYAKAIKMMSEIYPDTIFYFFSDDIDWCRENFGFVNNAKFVSDDVDDAIGDFNCMVNCKNNIIAYSTYSWWAAVLNNNKSKTVICPDFYCSKDVIPKSWIQIK